MKAVVFNLGCKVNQYESDMLGENLTRLGYDVSYALEPADVYILNTCAVTAEAERKSRQAVARCRTLNSQAKIFVCGCASQKSASSFKKDNVVFVAGATNKSEIIDHLVDITYSEDIGAFPSSYEEGGVSIPNRTRAYVKIQDGCDNFCSYCVIPYLRGRSRSRQISDVVEEVKRLADNTSEIVLIGINLMSYGRDVGSDLTALIKALGDVPTRIRFGSFYAEGITEDLLEALFSLKNFCPHFHLSLQSGDAKVLKDMNRRYTPEVYKEKIELIRKFDKNACIATDVITGFPTETEENHRNTVDFIREVKFSDIHVFPFSAREGTRAGRLKPLPLDVVKRRRDELLKLKANLRSEYEKASIGTEQQVLIEESDGEFNVGYSQYYIRIYTRKGNLNEIVRCVPGEIYKDGLLEVL